MKGEEVTTAFDAICPGMPPAVRLTLKTVPFTLHRHRWLRVLASADAWHSLNEISTGDGRANNYRIWRPLVNIGAISVEYRDLDKYFRITQAGRVLLKSWEQAVRA